MYAVINSSMGSGSVTYECEGNETRLSDCMSHNALSSTMAPCYYALVNCFSTIDKKSEGSTTSRSSAGIVTGVVVSLLAVLLVVTIVIIILIVWKKRNLKPAGSNANSTSTQLQSPTSSAPVGRGTDEASDVTLALGNPTYQTPHSQPAPTNGTPEHKFLNPLYSTATAACVNK